MILRRILAALLIVVASLLAPFAIGAVWADRTITDSQQFVETMAPLADNPEVQNAVSAAASAAVIERLDAAGRLSETLPNNPRLTSAVAAGVNGAIESAIDRYVHGEHFGDAWLRISQALQESFVRLLDHESQGAVTLTEGQIILDTRVAMELIRAELVERGVPFVASIDLSQAGQQIVLTEAPNLQLVADALDIFMPVADWLWLAVLVLFVGGVLLWPRRSRGLMWAGLGLALTAGLTYAGLDFGQALLVDAAATPERGVLLAEVTETALRFLINALLVMMAIGLAVLVAGALGGGTRPGTRLRLAIAGTAHKWGSPMADGPIGRATARTPLLVPALRGLVLVAVLAWLLLADRLTPSMILWACFWLALGLILVEIIEGAGLGHDSESSGEVAGS